MSWYIIIGTTEVATFESDDLKDVDGYETREDAWLGMAAISGIDGAAILERKMQL